MLKAEKESKVALLAKLKHCAGLVHRNMFLPRGGVSPVKDISEDAKNVPLVNVWNAIMGEIFIWWIWHALAKIIHFYSMANAKTVFRYC